jgi:hypothetical protein
MRLFLTLISATALMASGCSIDEDERADDSRFPLEPHSLFPVMPGPDTQVATGAYQGPEGSPEQPIPFSHKLHAGELEMQCQFCHNEARNSVHAGVPPLQTCMNCHQHIKTNNPNVQLIHQAYCGEPKCTVERDEFGQPVAPESAQPVPWKKVHDLPDYVRFTHKRHVRAGVECTECHGQVQLQGDYEWKTITHDGEEMEIREVSSVMVRESTLQMGWCLDCHGTHPSIDQNYGDAADLRRAELKDCWTCHK